RARRAAKGIRGDQTKNQPRSKKTGPELGRLGHSWLGFLALIYCARRRRWVPGHAKARFPGPRYIAPAGTPQKTHRPREHRPINMGSLLVLAGLLPWRRPLEDNWV